MENIVLSAEERAKFDAVRAQEARDRLAAGRAARAADGEEHVTRRQSLQAGASISRGHDADGVATLNLSFDLTGPGAGKALAAINDALIRSGLVRDGSSAKIVRSVGASGAEDLVLVICDRPKAAKKAKARKPSA